MRRGRVLLAAGGALWAAAVIVFGPPAPMVGVVWSDTPRGVREYLEHKFSLTDGEAAAGKWSYALRDTSADNRRALATHDAVAGIEGIDRRTFELAGRLPRATWRRGLIPAPEALARTIEVAALLVAFAGLVLLWRPTAVARAISQCRAAATSAVGWVQRGVPEASPEAAAAFRIAFGALAMAFVVSEPVYPALLTPLEVARASGPYGLAIRWLSDHPETVDLIRPALVVTGAAFAVGMATRVAFAAFTIVVLVWAIVYTLNFSSHTVSAFMLALLVLQPARWGDAWSVDAWLRRRRGVLPASSSRAYGYAFWAPGFVLAVAFAAAAWSKVREGPEWILNGTVKYHFVSDLEHAWVSWGLLLTRWHPVAVAMCIFAVAIEALLITSMFSRSYRYRAILAFLSFLMLVGFALFQGIVWFGWWLLLLAFLPWHLIAARARELTAHTTRPGITGPQAAAVCLLAAQQLVTTAMRVEARPMFSAYDMYATTYDSPEQYEEASNLEYRVVGVSGGRSADLPGCTVDDRVAAIARRALQGSAGDLELLRKAVGRCLRSSPEVQQVALEGDRQVFLWDESRFAWKRRLDVIGPIDADRLRE